MRLTESCPLCDKPLVLKSELAIGSEVIREYKCGHSFVTEISTLVPFKKELNFNSADTTKAFAAREYQKTGVEFIINSNFNCVIADQMRLGKTPQSLLALQNAYAERTPALILVRSANLYQWIREYKVWTDTLPMGIFPIIGSKNWIPPGFSAYIMSMDTFSKEGMVDKLLAMEFKLVIIDEAHSFKNPESNRSQALIQFVKEVSTREITKEIKLSCVMCGHTWTKDTKIKLDLRLGQATGKNYHHSQCEKCGAETSQVTQKTEMMNPQRRCGIVMLTGTPIKNRADEYFVLLNLMAPQRFGSLEHYRWDWLIQDSKGKWSRVNPYRLEAFKKEISQYVLRREKEDVYDSLPELNRMFTVITIEDERLKQAYNAVLDRIEIQMASRDNYSFFDSIGELMLLRQICGMAKVNWTADYAETMLMDSDNSRLAIGIHHHSVRDAIAYKLANIGVLKLSGEDSAEQKDRIMTKFENSPERILIINMLAGGVGMDFHYCNNVLILERQWNSADEEQFEYRFYNPDKSIKTASTNVEYIIAKGTIDEFFYDMVEEKRAIFDETIANNWSLQTDQDSFKQLMERTVSSRL
jgi:SNF2 family DNA or RNA helicase